MYVCMYALMDVCMRHEAAVECDISKYVFCMYACTYIYGCMCCCLMALECNYGKVHTYKHTYIQIHVGLHVHTYVCCKS